MKPIYWLIQIIFLIVAIETVDTADLPGNWGITVLLFMTLVQVVVHGVYFISDQRYILPLLRRLLKTVIVAWIILTTIEVASATVVDNPAETIAVSALVSALYITYLLPFWTIGAGVWGYFADTDNSEVVPDEDET